jgi:hypothetical protein
MAYIPVAEGIPGIRSLVLFRPETGKHLYSLVQVLLRGESPLKEAERELIAAYVSSLNECMFCRDSHAAAATFSMINRYVDGLDSLTPTDRSEYEAMGKRLGENGYVFPKNSYNIKIWLI